MSSQSPQQPYAPEIIRLLLIDDHPIIRTGLRLCLEMTTDLRVIGEADHAAAALNFLHTRQKQDPLGRTLPHIVLVDLIMPGMDGLALIRQLQRDFPAVAVLVLSMYDRADYILQAVRAGARGYLMKDEPAQHIIAAIHAVMQGRMAFSNEATTKLCASVTVNKRLTPRERDVLAYLGRGCCNTRIAKLLNVSVRTVETHRLNIRRKLHLDGQTALVKYAVETARAIVPTADGHANPAPPMVQLPAAPHAQAQDRPLDAPQLSTLNRNVRFSAK
jgi:DNA-binding NarL/FixJ family response regulator